MKNKLIDKIASIVFWISSLLLLIVSFVPLERKIKYVISPIALILWGISLLIVVSSGFWDLKIKDYDYFRNVLIGIFGGLTVWFLSKIDLSFPNGIMVGINDILIRLIFGVMVLVIGYKLVGRKEKC